MTDRPARFAGPRRPGMAALAVLLTFASLLALTTPAPAQSSEPQTIASDVSWFTLTPDGDRVVYEASRTEPEGPVQLYSAPVAGGAPTLVDPNGGPLYCEICQPPPEMFMTGSEPQPTIRFSPDSERMAYQRGPGGPIVVAGTAGGTPVELTDGNVGWVSDFVITPDWETAVFVANRRGEPARLYSVPITGGRPVRLAVLGRGLYTAALTPDGSRVVFIALGRSRLALRSVPVDGGTPVDLSDGRSVRAFTIAPDGRVAFVASEEPSVESPHFLYASSPNHRRANRITPDPVPGHPNDAHLTISADGRSVLYEDDVAPRRGVMRARLDGQRSRRIAPLDGRPGRLWESPDGRYLVSVRGLRLEPIRFGSPLLRITDVEQGTTTTRRARILWIVDPAPDGAHILVHVQRSWEEPARLRLITLGGDSRVISRSGWLGGAFTADSSRIVHQVQRAGSSAIVVVDTAGGRPTTLATSSTTHGFMSFAVSDSAERVVYLQRADDAPQFMGQLMVVDLPTVD